MGECTGECKWRVFDFLLKAAAVGSRPSSLSFPWPTMSHRRNICETLNFFVFGPLAYFMYRRQEIELEAEKAAYTEEVQTESREAMKALKEAASTAAEANRTPRPPTRSPTSPPSSPQTQTLDAELPS